MKWKGYDNQNGKPKLMFHASGVDHNPLPTTPRGKRRMRARDYKHPQLTSNDSKVMRGADVYAKYGNAVGSLSNAPHKRRARSR